MKHKKNSSKVNDQTILGRFKQLESARGGKFTPKELLKFITQENSNAKILQSQGKLNSTEYYEFYDYFRKKYAKKPAYINTLKQVWPNAPFVFQIAAAFINQSLRDGLTENQQENIRMLVDFITGINADRIININRAGEIQQYRFLPDLSEEDSANAKQSLTRIISDTFIAENAIIMLRCKTAGTKEEDLYGFTVIHGNIWNVTVEELQQSGEMDIVKNSEMNRNDQYCVAPIQFV